MFHLAGYAYLWYNMLTIEGHALDLARWRALKVRLSSKWPDAKELPARRMEPQRPAS